MGDMKMDQKILDKAKELNIPLLKNYYVSMNSWGSGADLINDIKRYCKEFLWLPEEAQIVIDDIHGDGGHYLYLVGKIQKTEKDLEKDILNAEKSFQYQKEYNRKQYEILKKLEAEGKL